MAFKLDKFSFLSISTVNCDLICGSELEFDLGETVNWGKKWLVDFKGGKTQLVSFDRSNNNGYVDVKMDGSLPEAKTILRCWG